MRIRASVLTAALTMLARRAGHLAAVSTLTVALLLPSGALGQRERASTQTVVLRGGWLFDAVHDDVRRNTGIIIVSGKLFEIDADLSGRDLSGARVVTLDDDEYILPGIFDLHAHYNVNLFGHNRRDEVVVQPVVYLANGVTSTFPAGEYNPEDMAALRERVDRGEQPGPRIYNSGPYFGSVRKGWDPDKLTPDSIYAEVDYWVSRGVKGFKAKGIGPVQLRALIERAHQHGLTVTGHLADRTRAEELKGAFFQIPEGTKNYFPQVEAPQKQYSHIKICLFCSHTLCGWIFNLSTHF